MAQKPHIPVRPFDAGEFVQNDAGFAGGARASRSTERTRTVVLPDGSWANVPSLWMAPQGPLDAGIMSDDFLSRLASEYEQQSGNKWLRFKSVKEAEAAAKARSDLGGAGAPTSRYAQ